MTADSVVSSRGSDLGPGHFARQEPPGFVDRLLAFGLPRLGSFDGPGACDGPLLPLASLTPGSRLSLAAINPPPLPQAFFALRRAAQTPTSTVTEVAGIISMDPSLAAYVLRLANSALYAPVVRVETVTRAVTLIGMEEIGTMAAGAMLGRLFNNPPRPDVLALPDFWRHAVAVGLLARALARRRGEPAPERFFVAGLLHDMGQLLLAVAEPDLALAVRGRAAGGRLPLDAAERLELSFDHAVLGGRICDKWHLPEALCQAVAGHHALFFGLDDVMAAAVHTADFIANVLGVRTISGVALPRLNRRVVSVFRLSEAEPQEFLCLLEEGLASMTALFTP